MIRSVRLSWVPFWLAAAASAACGIAQQSGTSTTPSGAAVSTFVGMWASPASSTTVAKLATCSNFQWNVTSQSGTAIAGQFSAVCLGTYEVTGTATGQLDGAVVHIVLNASATLPSVGACPVTLNADGSMDGDVIRVPYTAQTCLGSYSGTETLRKSQLTGSPSSSPSPDPTPAPNPDPAPDPTPVSADQIDLSQATIVLGPSNIAAWPQTSTMTGTKAVPDDLCTFHTKLGLWPTTLFFDTDALIEGNQWVFANIGGQWYGGAGEWMRPGQACKDVTAQSIAGDAFYSPSMEPLRSWVPHDGEEFAVMASTPARAWPSMRTVDERTNVVRLRWGQ